jgi:hypothetical protein
MGHLPCLITIPNMPSIHKSKKKKGSGATYNSMKEYDNRLDARAKTYRKSEKNVSTEQYVNPMYFGHKKTT